MRILSLRRAWPCIDGPLAGATIAVSRLAAWTGCTEARATVVQAFGGSTPPRFVDQYDRYGKPVLRAGEVIIGHYGAPLFWGVFVWEPSVIAPRWDALARDHRTPLGWMVRVSGASWNYRTALDVTDHHFSGRAA